MQEANLVCELAGDEKGEQSRFVPAISPEHMTLGLMTDRLESFGTWKISLPSEYIKSETWRKAITLRSNYLQEARRITLLDFWVAPSPDMPTLQHEVKE